MALTVILSVNRPVNSYDCWWPDSSRLWFWPSQTWVVSPQPFPLWHWAMCSQSTPVFFTGRKRCPLGIGREAPWVGLLTTHCASVETFNLLCHTS